MTHEPLLHTLRQIEEDYAKSEREYRYLAKRGYVSTRTYEAIAESRMRKKDAVIEVIRILEEK